MNDPRLAPSSPSSNSRPARLLRRLNGRPQACDPCRSRKVACDNVQPVCDRCRKRNQAARCTYTISNQTVSQEDQRQQLRQDQSRSPVTPSRTASSSTSRRAGARARDRLRPGAAGAASASTTTASQTVNTTRGAARSPATRISTPPPPGEGYLGFISYSNVFDEARNTLSLLNNDGLGLSGGRSTGGMPSASNTNNPSPADLPSTSSLSQRSHPVVSHHHADSLSPAVLALCLDVLRSLPDPNYPGLSKPRGSQPAGLWGLVSADRIMNTLRRRYGAILGPTREDAKLERMARDICANSAKPFDNDLEDPEAFLNQFAGEDLRWESLGFLFSFREYAPDVNGSGAAPPPQPRGWHNTVAMKAFSEPARHCLHNCLQLARRYTEGNTILMYVQNRQMILDSLVYGDSSLKFWLSHSEAVAIAIWLGFHAITNTPDYKPSLASELKRRFFAHTMILDKDGASFHGRPPLLGHRYATSPQPLDLRDEALLAGGEELDRAVAELDEYGWRTDGQMDTVTLQRARAIIATVKDEFMEIAHGSSRNASIAVIREIQHREQRTYDSFPPWCKYRDEDLDDLNLGIDTVFARLLLLLEHLQACLIAERLIARHNAPDDGSLLFISFEMVRHVLVLWMHIDRFDGGWNGARVDYLWMVMSFGAPGGGVLCMELLFPTLPNRPIPYTSPTTPRITRSAIIQNLSLLVGFLGWVGPDAPISEMTTNCKRVIQSVLDYTLNHSPAAVSGTQVAGEGATATAAGGGFFDGLDMGEMDLGFDLLGTFDWFRPEDPIAGFG